MVATLQASLTRQKLRAHTSGVSSNPELFESSPTHQQRLLVPNHRWAVPARNSGAPRRASLQEFFLMTSDAGNPRRRRPAPSPPTNHARKPIVVDAAV
jgi:hypothetical protein